MMSSYKASWCRPGYHISPTILLLSPMNPPKILINSAGNFRVIPEESTWKIPLNFHVDSCFTDNPNFYVDSPPPCTRHLRGFPAESA